jgi:DNA-binding response OmpR family regulator
MDIRLQLRDNLSESYHIIEAIDGMAGFKKATEAIPDLIITDIMMPKMDGSEMCHKLKNDERTSHIPVIMLTAKVTQNDKINGYHTGADDYIPKPFLMAELKARGANLLLQRQKLRERYSREIKLEPTDVLITPLDEKFLKRAVEIVENHINEEDFDLIKFRTEMNMSRSTLSRKLHALTGESPTDFIRNIRLKRAGDLLKKKFGNVTQVSFEVGFSNLSYFNKSFRKLYGVTPTEYAKKHRQMS